MAARLFPDSGTLPGVILPGLYDDEGGPGPVTVDITVEIGPTRLRASVDVSTTTRQAGTPAPTRQAPVPGLTRQAPVPGPTRTQRGA